MKNTLKASKIEAEKTFNMDKNIFMALTDSLTTIDDSKDFDTIIDVTEDAPLKNVDIYNGI